MSDIIEYRVFSRPPGGGPSEAGQWQPVTPGTVPEFRSTLLPSADALRAYLTAGGWIEGAPGRFGTVWAFMSQPERDLIHADLGQLLDLLGLGDHARPESPHEVFQQCIREVARVIDRNGVLGRVIDSASRELRKAARDD